MAQSQSWWSGFRQKEETPHDAPSFASRPLEDTEFSDPDTERLLTRRVHILGLGSIGMLVAHSLRCLPNPPPITLMVHKHEQYEEFKRAGRAISLINKENGINDEQTGYDVDLIEKNDTPDADAKWQFIPDRPWMKEQTNPVEEQEKMPSGELYIHSLIVAVKGPFTVKALRSVKHRVNAETTICFMQNGLGQIEELNREVFTDPETRPTYLLGIVSHGVYAEGPCAIVHAGFGTVALGIYRDPNRHPLPDGFSPQNISDLPEDERRKYYPTDKDLFASLSSRFLLRTLTRSPVLACAAFPYLDLFQLQLEKLSTNAVLNPLTALYDVPNGAMLNNFHLSVVQKLLLAEISLVIRSLPELEGIPNVRLRFSAKRLEELFLGVSRLTAKNSSSMREDIRNGKVPEIDYINGYIVKRGEQLGIQCVLNLMVMQMIKAKRSLKTGTQNPVPYGTTRIESEMDLDRHGIVTISDESTSSRGSVQ
ncbi:uncharacterized protein Z518_07892 [Rhinocladiella mackenziei CBS 650.93]|uniref:2-dehydropantoate 2-reductase n=1 Tax=Rhinocladiella mackenziei CBS 650.93 TaxID=1442369 RepID=A0A0D2GUH4_9EURO|nr:uncharacterized protein Z518_07892 [Rhinocladiella mackenziei CBS 650.93]KIX01953.1 hypothetical protein Z518_07892 [Rhinocladiella mackenziei CBS 650.93]